MIFEAAAFRVLVKTLEPKPALRQVGSLVLSTFLMAIRRRIHACLVMSLAFMCAALALSPTLELTQLTMSGVRIQSLYTPLSIPSTEVIHFKQLGGHFASFPIDVTHIVKTFDIDVLFAEPVVFEADIYSADDT